MATVTVTFPFAITNGDAVGTNNFTSSAGTNNTLSYNSTASAGYASSTGCLQSLRSVKSATSSSNTWTWNNANTLTYVALGVPSGSTVIGISNAAIWWKCTAVTSPGSCTAGVVTLNDGTNTAFNLASVWGTTPNTSAGQTFSTTSSGTITASQSGTTLTVSAFTSGGVYPGMSIGTSGGGTNTCTVVSQLTGSTPSTANSTFQVTTSATVGSGTWTVNNNGYAQMPGASTTFTSVPASTLVKLIVNNTLASTNVTSSGETLLQDQLTFTIQYTPPAAKIGGHGGRSWENSLLGRWVLDEGGGTVARDSAGTQNNGTLATAASILPTYVRSEKFNSRVLAFEDNSSYVDLGAMNYADMAATDSFSVACWVKYQEVYFTAHQDTGVLGNAGTLLTVTAVSDGIIANGMSIQTTAGASAATITALGTGVGGTGTYTLSTTANVSSTTWVGTRYVRFNPIISKCNANPFSNVFPGWELYMDRGATPSAATIGFGGFQITDNLGSKFTAACLKTAPANKWHFLVGVYDANASQIRVSIDGQAFDSVSTTGIGSFTSTKHVEIGFDNGTSNPGMKFHDLRIWKRALTAGEVSQLYQITERPKLWPPARLSEVLGAGGLNTVLAFSNKSWVWLGQGAKFNTAETPPEKSWVWNKQAFTQDFKPAIPQKFWVWSPAGAILPKTTVVPEKSWVWSKSFKFDFEPQTNQKLWVWAKQAITVATTPTFATKNWVWNKTGPVQAFVFATLPEKNWVWTKQAPADTLTITPPEKSWVWSKSFTYTFAPALPKVNWVWKPTGLGFSSYVKDFFVWNPQAPVLTFNYPMPLQAWAWVAQAPHIGGSPLLIPSELNWVWNPQAPTLQYATHLVEKNWVYQGESFPANTTNVETLKPEPWTKHAPLFGFANVETEKNYVWTKNVITLARNVAMVRKNWNFATNPASLSGGNITTKALHYAGGFPTRRRRSHPPE